MQALQMVGEYIGLALQSAWRREGLRKEMEDARRELEGFRRMPRPEGDPPQATG